jgi:hypothetical protein
MYVVFALVLICLASTVCSSSVPSVSHISLAQVAHALACEVRIPRPTHSQALTIRHPSNSHVPSPIIVHVVLDLSYDMYSFNDLSVLIHCPPSNLHVPSLIILLFVCMWFLFLVLICLVLL